MQINSLLSFIKNHTDFAGKFSEKKISDSVFAKFNEYLKNADKSEDNIISSEELSELYETNGAEILAAFKLLVQELENVDATEVTNDLFNISKDLIEGNDEINEDISALEDISLDDFIENSEKTDFEDETLSKFWGAIKENDAKEIFEKLDENKDGKLSKEELNKFSEIDGEKDNISLTDLSQFINPETLLEDESETLENTEEPSVGTEETDEPTSTKPDEDTTTQETNKPKETSKPSSTPSSTGGSYNSGSPTNDGGNVVPTVPENDERTVEQINSEIKEQESSRNEIKSKSEKDIAENEGKISEAVSKSDLSEEFKEEYENETKRLDEEISNKDKEIDEQTVIYQDALAKADTLKSAAGEISSQITELEGKMNNLGEDSGLKEKYQTSIQNLTTEKEKLEEEERAERDKADSAKEQIDALKKDKSDLEKEKDNLLDTLSEKFSSEKEKVEKIKEDIKEYQENIKTIRENLEKDLETVDGNIQKLKNEKAQLEQAPKTKEIINSNRPVDRTPTSLNENIQNVNWEDYGYNPETGKKFADSAVNVESRLRAKGKQIDHNCLGGVKDTFIDVTGESPFGLPEQGITVASQCLDTMRNNENYREITGISAGELGYLPAGAVVVWSSSSGGSSPADLYGHISVSLGDGRESSSKIRQQLTSVGQNGKPTVFIPIT
ncbi:hypothetical protein IKQ26_08850 [bacterium]|nr:hypothetical protein [bacterium]